MSLIIVDTETTGLRVADGGPGRLVQLAWVRLSEDGHESEARSMLVRPDGFSIPPEAEAIHGITTARAQAEGIPLAHALVALGNAIVGVQEIAAHNADFDRAVLAAEAARIGCEDLLRLKTWTCTMKLGAPVCRIPRLGGWKQPTLIELHQHLFGTGFEDAHDALADARATARCFIRLREVGALAAAPQSVPPPTEEQTHALGALERFMSSNRAAFVLLGAAGTGKTTLLRHLAERAEAQGRTIHLLAPTGRAARVAARRTGLPAQTIHSHIYSYLETEADTDDVESSVTLVFGLRPNDAPPGTLFVVDEASMVADRKDEDGMLRFGSGRLLTDLIRYAALHDRIRGHQVVFVGDPAQLPPVGSPNSPALVIQTLAERHGLDAEALELTQVLRQRAESGILESAHRIRSQISASDFSSLGIEETASDVETVLSTETVATYLKKIEKGGLDAAILIARTNKATAALNAAVRQVLFRGVPSLVERDRLIIVQNNLCYELFNGDFVEVIAVSDHVEQRTPLKGIALSWREVTVREADSKREVTAYLLDDLITSEAGNLSSEQVQALIVDFRQRYPHLKPKTTAFEEALRSDPYVHALRARHGYALTCHKAQGGEWPTAIVVFDGRTKGWANEDYFRWTYTAITRAKDRLVVVRPPRHTAISDLMWTGTDTTTPSTPLLETGRLEDLLSSSGLNMTGVQDLPYRRRLTFTRNGVVGRVDIVYDGKQVVKSVQPMGSGSGGELAADAVRSLGALIGNLLDTEAELTHPFEPPEDFFEGQPHLTDLYRKFRQTLEGTGIVIASIKHHQWMERYTFCRNGECAELDIYYNAKGRFTKARAVRPSALVEEIQALWSAS